MALTPEFIRQEVLRCQEPEQLYEVELHLLTTSHGWDVPALLEETTLFSEQEKWDILALYDRITPQVKMSYKPIYNWTADTDLHSEEQHFRTLFPEATQEAIDQMVQDLKDQEADRAQKALSEQIKSKALVYDWTNK